MTVAKFLGEGEVTANGKTWRLRFDMGTLAELEEMFPGRRAADILQEIDGDKPSMSVMRKLCRAMMLRHHKDATLDDAADLLSEAAETVMAIVIAANPEAEDAGGNVQAA